MEKNKPLVNRQVIVDLLFGDEEYVGQFAAASVESFTEFKDNFQQSLRTRDMDTLKKAGHKIKPAAQIMHLSPILEMYEKSKSLLENNAPENEISDLIKNMNRYCEQLLIELEELR